MNDNFITFSNFTRKLDGVQIAKGSNGSQDNTLQQ